MPRLLLLALLAFAGAVPLPARTLQDLPPGAVVLSGSPAAADAKTLAALRAGEALHFLLDRAGPEAFEPAAEAFLAELAVRRPTPAEADVVARLKQHVPMLWRRHPETAAVWFEPVLDIAGMAAGIEARWRLEDAVQAELDAGAPDWRRWSGLDAVLLATLLERLPQQRLQQLVADGVPPGLGSAPWQVLLRRVPRADLWRLALQLAPDDALRRLAPAVWDLGPDAALGWLERLRLERSALNSVAVFGLGRDPDAERRKRRLVALLADPKDRAAAAAALAQDPALSDAELVRALEQAEPDALAGHVLVLRLRDSAETRNHLQRNERSLAERLRRSEPRP